MWIICFLIIHISIAFLFSFSFSRSDTPSGGGRSGQEVYQSWDFIDGESEAPAMKKAPHMTPLFPPSSNVPLKMSGGVRGLRGYGGKGVGGADGPFLFLVLKLMS